MGTKEQNATWRNHYVPQVLQKNFSSDETHVWHANRQHRSVKKKSTRSVGFEKYLYNPDLGGKRIFDSNIEGSDDADIEKRLGRLEDFCKPALEYFKSSIISNSEVEQTVVHTADLIIFAYILCRRTPEAIGSRKERFRDEALSAIATVEQLAPGANKLSEQRVVESFQAIGPVMEIFPSPETAKADVATRCALILQAEESSFVLGSPIPGWQNFDEDVLLPVSPERAILIRKKGASWHLPTLRMLPQKSVEQINAAVMRDAQTVYGHSEEVVRKAVGLWEVRAAGVGA